MLALAARGSPLRRRCRAPTPVSLALVAAVTLTPTPTPAQTLPVPGAAVNSGNAATPGTDNLLLPPPPGSNPALRFRRPGTLPPSGEETPPTGTFTAPNRLGLPPTYGSPNAFGAGNTGFDSLNTPRSKKKKKTPAPGQAPLPVTPPAGSLLPPQSLQPNATFAPVPSFNPAAPATVPAATQPPAPEIHPLRAAVRTGAILPPPPDEAPLSNPLPEVHPAAAANRPGAVTPTPPLEYYDITVRDISASTPPPTLQQPNTYLPGVLPQRPLPLAATDPYAALGIRAGSFLLQPSLDLSTAYVTNAERVPGSAGSAYLVAAPELKVQSDWERHSLTADIAGSYTQYATDLVPSLNVPFLNAKVDGRIDVSRDTQIIAEQRFIVNTDNPGSPNIGTQVAKLPINTDVGETLGVAQEINRLLLTFKGTFDRAVYDPSLLTDGVSASNSDRNFDQYAGIARVGYELDPGFTPFVEVQEDDRVHDEEFDRSHLQRDSVGTTAKVGSDLNLFGSLTGEMAVGYVNRDYQDATLPSIHGPIADGALIWQPTGLTTFKLGATSQVYETVLAGASGELSRDVNLEIDHAFRTWLIGQLRGGYGNDEYVGITLLDNRYFVSLGLTYILNRDVQVRAQVRQDWQIATQSGFNYNATSFLLGLHLQR